MNMNFLEFEQPIAELEAKIQELRMVGKDTDINLSEEIARLENKSVQLTKDIFTRLTPWQVTQLARHPLRPHTIDYVKHIFTDVHEVYGDRCTSAGHSIITALARLDGQPVVVMGHEKGRKTHEKIERNFGMPQPEDYRKALRLMRLAEKFRLPLITFIDTPGAYPGIGSEERNQSEAIARNLMVMAKLETPIVSVVIGEGGSGGALAIGVADRVLMLQHAVYSVITPEGCASILWKSAAKAPEAAAAMGMTAMTLRELKLIDAIIQEPIGGAHRDEKHTIEQVHKALVRHLSELRSYSMDSLLSKRYNKIMAYGHVD